MKRILAVILTVGLILGLSAATALAEEPAQSYNVSGIIQAAENGMVSGTLTDRADPPAITLTVSGTITDFEDHTATLTGTVSGDIEGELHAVIDDNGVAALSGEIVGEDVRWWITGVFPISVADGQFVGSVSAAPPAAYVTVETATGENKVEAGKTLQMTARVEPDGASDKVAWSVRTADGSGAAEIDVDTGLLTGKKAGIVTVTAKALDGSLKYAEMQVTVTEAAVAAALQEESSLVDPVYTIVIPGTVDFGKIQKGTGIKTESFVIEAEDVQLDGGKIKVRVHSTFEMTYKGQHIPYYLLNSSNEVVGNGEVFAEFTGDGQEESGTVNIDTANVTHSGSYIGIMSFIITYEK